MRQPRTEMYVVTTGCAARIPLAILPKEEEAYFLASALDGLVDHIAYYRSSRDARKDSNIAYEVQRVRGTE